MTKPTSYSKVAIDLYWVQLTWTFWFLGIYLLINVVRFLFGMKFDSFFSGAYIASNIYMFVIGIIAVSFLAYYVENGVTRKSYFIGNMIASVALSITLPILTYVISLIEKMIVNRGESLSVIEDTINEVVADLDGHLIGEVIVSFILTPYIDIEKSVFLSLALFSLNLFVFYIAGWLISAAFYRFGIIPGILMIAVGIAIVAIKDTMIRLLLDGPVFKAFTALSQVPDGLALPIVAFSIMIALIIIYLLTKRAPVKM